MEWGYDGLIIDTEHATFDPPALRGVLMAFRGTDCVPIVRVTANDPALIKIVFDLGAGGVLIPLVDDAASAQAAVAACRYAPEGRRGVAPRRAANYNRDTATYLAEANSSLIVMVQIESFTAYRNLDEILAVPGSTAASSARPICRQRWGIWATSGIRRLSRSFSISSGAAGRPFVPWPSPKAPMRNRSSVAGRRDHCRELWRRPGFMEPGLCRL